MTGVIISEDTAVRARLEGLLTATPNVDSVLTIPEYPDAASIRTLEGTGEKYVAFIDFRDHSAQALALACEMDRSCPSVGSVALNVGSSQADLIAIVRAGVCEVLPHPFSDQDVGTAVINVARKLAVDSTSSSTNGMVYAFLPAKPGAGASSLAVYSALACARQAKPRPLLLDFDVRLGASSFVLKLDSKNCIMDALENATRMDETLWEQLVCQRDNLDVLGSAPTEFGVRIPGENFQAILHWARPRYSAIIVDLPGNLEDFEIATLHQAGMIFLVCSPNLISLHMARKRLLALRSLELQDRVCLVMNRVEKRTGLSISDIESVLGMPVAITVPADESGIAEAVQAGTGINAKSAFGIQIELIGRRMSGQTLQVLAGAPRPKKKFIEYFSVPQNKGLDTWRL